MLEAHVSPCMSLHAVAYLLVTEMRSLLRTCLSCRLVDLLAGHHGASSWQQPLLLLAAAAAAAAAAAPVC